MFPRITRLVRLSAVCFLAAVGLLLVPTGASAAPRVFTSNVVNDNSNKCLDVLHAGTADFTNVQQFTCNANSVSPAAQTWTFTAVAVVNGSAVYELQNPHSGNGTCQPY